MSPFHRPTSPGTVTIDARACAFALPPGDHHGSRPKPGTEPDASPDAPGGYLPSRPSVSTLPHDPVGPR